MKSTCLIVLAALAMLSVVSANSSEIEKETKFLFRPKPWIPLPIPLPRPAGGQCSIPTQGGCLACGATGSGPQCGGDISKRAQCYDPTASSPCPADCADNCQPKCDQNCDW